MLKSKAEDQRKTNTVPSKHHRRESNENTGSGHAHLHRQTHFIAVQYYPCTHNFYVWEGHLHLTCNMLPAIRIALFGIQLSVLFLVYIFFWSHFYSDILTRPISSLSQPLLSKDGKIAFFCPIIACPGCCAYRLITLVKKKKKTHLHLHYKLAL